MTDSTVPPDCIERVITQHGAGRTVQKMFTALFRRRRGKLLAGHSPILHTLPMLRTEESSLHVDLRVHGVSQDDIYKDGEQITEMQHLVDRLKDGCCEKSIIQDLKQKGVSNVLSEESKRKLEGMAKIDLYERSETVRTIQCLEEGTIYCGCGKCLIHSRTRSQKSENNRHPCRTSVRY